MDPKTNTTILNHYLPTRTLLRTRITCKSWNRITTPLLQSRMTITFHHVKEISSYLATFKNYTPFFARFCFKKVRLNFIQDNYLLRSFFKKHEDLTYLHLDFTGPTFRIKYLRMCILSNLTQITSLSLNFKDFSELYLEPSTTATSSPNIRLPTVQSLTIYGYGKELVLKSVVMELLPHFPNVTRIEAGEQFGRILFDLFDKIKLNLRHLDLTRIYPAQADFIATNELKLTSLSGTLQGFNNSQLQNLLSHLAPSLEELFLEGIGAFSTPKTTPMNNVTRLELCKFTLELAELNNFLQLKTLILKMVKISVVRQLCPLETLTILKLDISEVNSELIKGLAEMFPKLRKLDTSLVFEGNELFGEVCTEFKSLQEVVVLVFDSVLGNHVTLGEGEDGVGRVVKVFDRTSGGFLARVVV